MPEGRSMVVSVAAGLSVEYQKLVRSCFSPVRGGFFSFLQACEQTVISGQARAHFFRQAKGRWQTAQSLVGR